MIYFLITEDDKYVKIGFTSRENTSRKHDYNTHSPYDLKLALFIPGDRNYEKRLHDIFKADNKRNEWYYLNSNITTFIEDNKHLNITFKSRAKVNQQIRNSIIEMYKQGYHLSVIANKYQRTVKSVKRIAERAKAKREHLSGSGL